MPGIYIHIPFCKSKCKYCDFVSGVYEDNIRKRYFDVLKNEIFVFFKSNSFCADSVYIGGGTPSLVDARYIEEALRLLYDFGAVQTNSEISLEANPGTVTKDKCLQYKEFGINRISIGLQTDNNALLSKIGRIHTRKDFEQTIEYMLDAGIYNLNTDIIYALPGQSIKEFESTANYVACLPVKHISCYSLKIEKGTPLWKAVNAGEILPVDDDTDREMYHIAQRIFEENGFLQYEISNFAKSGYECRHNIKYWTHDEYVGFGVAAHSFINNTRFANTPDIFEYISKKGLAVSTEEKISDKDLEFEYLMLRLRLKNGFEISDYEQKFSVNFLGKYGKKLNTLVSDGLIMCQNGNVFLTNKGMDLQNYVLIQLGI